MKALSYVAGNFLAVSIFFFVGSFTAMAQVTPPVQPTPPAPHITSILGVITAIDTLTGEESVTIAPRARGGQTTPALVVVPIDASTSIRLFDVPDADLSDLAVGDEIFAVERVAIPVAPGVDAVPASTDISADTGLPIDTIQHESAP